jgi:hypothetical protein
MLNKELLFSETITLVSYETCRIAKYGLKAQSTYVCWVQISVWRLPKYWPPTPLHPPSVSSLRTKGRGVHTRRAVRGWGPWGGNILEDARHWIGLLQYNLSTAEGLLLGSWDLTSIPTALPLWFTLKLGMSARVHEWINPITKHKISEGLRAQTIFTVKTQFLAAAFFGFKQPVTAATYLSCINWNL